MPHCTKFCAYRSNHFQGMTIFQFIKMAAVHHLVLSKVRNWKCRVKFCADWLHCFRDMGHFWIFQNVGHPPFDLLYASLDNPWRAFGGLCYCAKFGWNRCSSFDNIQDLIFCTLGLKTGSDVNKTPKRHILAWKGIEWRINRQNRSTGAKCACDKDTKKKERQRNLTVANWVIAQATHIVGSKSNFV